MSQQSMSSSERQHPLEGNTLLSILNDERSRAPPSSAPTLPPLHTQFTPSPGQSRQPSDAGHLRKKPRSAHACEPCRVRKTKCGGEKPVCAACQRRGADCTYEHSTHSAPKRKASSHDLRDESYQSNTPTQPPQSRGRQQQNVTQTTPSSSFSAINSARQREARPHVVVSPVLHDHQDDLEPRKSERNGVYGPTSTVAFLNTISDEPVNVNDPQPLTLGQRKPHDAQPTYRPPEKMISSNSKNVMLPRRRDADEYMRCFWDFLHPLFPVLHKPSFVSQYEQLWVANSNAEPNDFEENMFMSALNMVFAIGCKFSKLVSNKDKSSLADEFYQRSRRIFCYDVLDTASLDMIQLLLLQVVYLQSTHYAVRCWNAIGLAVRASQSIGLHLQHSQDNRRSQLQLEMRRRIWHTCVSLDRLVAIVFGRSATIKQTPALPLPALIDDEYLREDAAGRQPTGRLPQLALFHYSCQLFDVLEDVIATFYSGQSALMPRNLVTDQPHALLISALDFNRRIDDFIAGLPSWLRNETTAATEPHIRLQQSSMRMRTSYVRLLALRPLLMLVTSNKTYPQSSTLDEELIRSCCMLCVETAKSLTYYTYTHLKELYQPTPWHTSLSTCASMMVFLAAFKSGQVAWDDRELHKSWDQAVAVLKYYQDQVSPAAEGISVLQRLKQQLLASHKQPGRMKQNEAMRTPQSLQQQQDDIDLSDVSFDFEDITDSWFSQHFLDTNWLDMPAL